MYGESHPADRFERIVFMLRHIDTGEYVCLRREGREHLASFSEPRAAQRFQEEMRLVEFVDIVAMPLGDAPFDWFWLDGVAFGRSAVGQPRQLAA